MAAQTKLQLFKLNEMEIDPNTNDRELINALCLKNHNIWWEHAEFWRPHLEKGNACWNGYMGQCFTPQEIEEMGEKDKIPIQVPRIFSKINIMSGMQRNSRRDGIVVGQGSEDAAPAKIVNTILKAIRQQNNLDQERSEAFMRGMVVGYPVFVWVDKEYDSYGNKDICAYTEAWNAVLPDMHFTRPDLSDCGRLIRVKLLTKERLLECYPSAEKRINAMPDIVERDMYHERFGLTSEQRTTLYDDAQNNLRNFQATGLVTVIERLEWKHNVQTVYMSPYDPKPFVVPPDWDEERIMEWRSENPRWIGTKRKVKILWVTTTTLNGVILENRPHWLQTGRFPCAMYIPAMLNNQPTGWVEFLLDNQKMNSVFRTEYVHSVRVANDKLMVVKDGALSDPEQALEEKARTGGVITLSKTASRDDLWFVEDKGGNQGLLEASAVADDDLEQITSLPPITSGAMESANEPYMSSSRRIQQSQIAQGVFLDNFLMFDVELHRVLLDAIVTTFDKHRVIRYVKGEDEVEEIEVNAPAEVDPITMEVTKVVNRLDAAKYDYMQAAGDNSVTGRETEFAMFMKVSTDILRNMPPEQWENILATIPNTYAKELAGRLAEFRQQREEAAANQGPMQEPAKVSLSLKGEDLQNPAAQAILEAQGVIPPQQETQAPVAPMAPEPVQQPDVVELPPEILELIAGGQPAL